MSITSHLFHTILMHWILSNLSTRKKKINTLAQNQVTLSNMHGLYIYRSVGGTIDVRSVRLLGIDVYPGH